MPVITAKTCFEHAKATKKLVVSVITRHKSVWQKWLAKFFRRPPLVHPINDVFLLNQS